MVSSMRKAIQLRAVELEREGWDGKCGVAVQKITSLEHCKAALWSWIESCGGLRIWPKEHWATGSHQILAIMRSSYRALH